MKHTFQTHNGLTVTVRRMRRSDTRYIINIFDHLGSQSRYQRFNEPLPAPDPALVQMRAEELLAVTARQGHGWLAFADLPAEPHAPVGGVRWVRTEPGVAEMALTIRDDLQGQGIGLELLRIGVLDARASGIRTLLAVLQASNQGIAQLLRHAPLPIKRTYASGEVYIEADLTSSAWEMLKEDSLLTADLS